MYYILILTQHCDFLIYVLNLHGDTVLDLVYRVIPSQCSGNYIYLGCAWGVGQHLPNTTASIYLHSAQIAMWLGPGLVIHDPSKPR